MARSKSEPNRTIGPRAGIRSLDILSALASSRNGMSLSELMQTLELPRASLHRLLRQLVTTGFLSNRSGNYSLGPRSFDLAREIGRSPANKGFPACAKPVIEELARETDETVILGALSESRNEIVYADVIVADSPLRYAVPTGDRRPLYSSASGKAVLAFMADREIEDYIRRTDFEPITSCTTTREQLAPVLAETRKKGVVTDVGGHFVGAMAIASPIFNEQGDVFSAVVVAGPTDRLQGSVERTETLVRVAGEAISRSLGYRGDYPASPPA